MLVGYARKEVTWYLGVSIPALYRWVPASVDHDP
jgi:hypothetical protein